MGAVPITATKLGTVVGTVPCGDSPCLQPGCPGPLVVRARPGADHGLLRASVLEENRRRDREDAEARSRLDVLVDVQLREGDLAIVLPLELGEDRLDRATGAAPRGPEVDDDGLARLEHVALEALVGHL